MKTFTKILIFGSLLTGGHLAARDLYSLSLEELLSIQVASKSEESNLDAAGVVAVVTQADIKRYGARNLRDILDRLANLQVIGSNLFPHNRVSIRGITQTHTDNKVLLLLNGRVVRDGNQGGINSDIYNLFPVNAIHKIEVIRGPGSVIYGTNAFSGIINIITHGGKSEFNQLSVTQGSFGSSMVTATTSMNLDDFQISATAAYEETDGDNFDNVQGEFGTSGTYPTDKKGKQLVLTGKLYDATFNLLLSSTDQGNVKSLFQFPSAELAIDRTHLDIGYQWQLSSNWSVESHYTYNHHDVAFDISNARGTETISRNTLLEAIAKGKFSDTLSLIFGLNYEKIDGTLGINSDNEIPFEHYQLSAFSQFNWQLDDKNRFILGAQINQPEDKSSNVSPRLAYIRRLSADWTFKALYGEAFRSPFATDLFLDSPSLQGNPNLKPEIIKTFDFQLIRQTASGSVAMTYYQSRHTDLHVREIINGSPTFINEGRVDYQGVELELRKSLTPQLDFNLNASYQKNEDENGFKQVTYNPETMFKMGFAYNANNGISFGLYDSYFSAPTDPFDLGLNPTVLNAQPQAYQLLTANLSFDLNTFLALSTQKSMSLSFYVDNLLDEEIYFPSINRTKVSSLPHHVGRNINISFALEF